jgi:hypothetical protein
VSKKRIVDITIRMQYLIKESKMNTQKEVMPRPDRPLTNTNHAVVEAHGATPDHVQESDFDGHLTGEFEHKGEDVAREVGTSKATAGRHTKSGKDGLAIAKERSAYLESARKAHQKSWDSNKLTVVPEKRKK